MSEPPKTKRQTLEQQQRSSKWEYVTLLRELQDKPKSQEMEARLANLRRQIDEIDAALKSLR